MGTNKIADQKILFGVVNRASTLSLLFAIIATAYGFISYEYLKMFVPEFRLTESVLTRFVLLTIPHLIIYFYCRNYKENTNLKAIIWVTSFPFLYMVNCLIYSWPIMAAGHPELYLYVHGLNIFVIPMSFLIVTPPPKLMFLQLASYLLFFFAPLTYVLLQTDSTTILNLGLGDLTLALVITLVATYHTHKLRFKLTVIDIEIKKTAAPFLGKTLTEAIYENRNDILNGFHSKGIVLSLDMRGYTNFIHHLPSHITKSFMDEYHSKVSKLIGEMGGYVHKMTGDGHIISFGVMNDIEPGEITNFQTELAKHEPNKRKACFIAAVKSFENIMRAFEELKGTYFLHDQIKLGAGISFGEVDVKILGNNQHRQELDIVGEIIVKAVRLETYSKILNNKVDNRSSFLVIDEQLEDLAKSNRSFKMWTTDQAETQIRDFPGIKKIFYRRWAHNRARDKMVS